MTNEQLEKMQKWQSYATLLGFSMDKQIAEFEEDPSDIESTQSLINIIHLMEEFQNRMDNPDDVWSLALATRKMNITSNEILEYDDYLECEKQRQEDERLLNLETTNENLSKLINEYKFKFTKSVKYKNHLTYEYTMKSGLVVSGRILDISWNSRRTWTVWTDANNKTHKHKMESMRYIAVPKGFPEEWKTRWSGAAHDAEQFAKIVVWNQIMNKKLDSTWAKPKK